jgi:hypothetical protein
MSLLSPYLQIDSFPSPPKFITTLIFVFEIDSAVRRELQFPPEVVRALLHAQLFQEEYQAEVLSIRAKPELG